MARQPISEYASKKIISAIWNVPQNGTQIKYPDLQILDQLDQDKYYVVKVDQGIKRRFKQGLIILQLSAIEVKKNIKQLHKRGYHQFLVEEFELHKPDDERYLAITRVRNGFQILYGEQGGVDIETRSQQIKSLIYTNSKVGNKLPFHQKLVSRLCEAMNTLHLSFVEINPLVQTSTSEYKPLDVAIEVDTAGEFLVQNWSKDDYVFPHQVALSQAERTVHQLDQQSQASFNLQILNPQGSIGMLLSGGGASIVLADQVYDQGYGQELINYGEYSGNPNAIETELYTDQILELLLQSSAPKKILIIAGGVANFTDIRITFQGIIKSLLKHHLDLYSQGIKVYVRRGGPFHKSGLQQMTDFLQQYQLYGQVSGPEINLTDII